jgi:hypothetical protein
MSSRCRRCSTRSDTSRRSSNTSRRRSDTSRRVLDTAKSWSFSNTSKKQRHVHEFLGSTEFAEEGNDRHNHRFAGVSGEAIRRGNSHIHCIKTRTDTTEDHFHEICEQTGPAIFIDDGSGCKHIHFVEGRTSREDGHRHGFQFATLIEDPTGK